MLLSTSGHLGCTQHCMALNMALLVSQGCLGAPSLKGQRKVWWRDILAQTNKKKVDSYKRGQGKAGLFILVGGLRSSLVEEGIQLGLLSSREAGIRVEKGGDALFLEFQTLLGIKLSICIWDWVHFTVTWIKEKETKWSKSLFIWQVHISCPVPPWGLAPC